MNKKGRVVSGMQPTGKLHLGNLLGALQNWVKLQEEYECFYVIVDLHALTSGYSNTKDLKENIFEVSLDWLSAGLDPKKSTLFIQSDVPQHSELHLLLSMITPLSWLERVPTYKGKMQELQGKIDLSTYGFLGYPVLQASDILIYKADTVPVGEDQIPHLELTREIARRFNYFYGEVFPLPQAKLTKVPKVIGIDGKKMSKSYENCIYISDEPQVIMKKVNLMITDPQKIKLTDVGHPDVCIVYSYQQIYNENELHNIREKCISAKLGCVACKKNLAEKIIDSLVEIQKKRKELKKDRKEIENIFKKGGEKAREIADNNLKEIKKAMRMYDL